MFGNLQSLKGKTVYHLSHNDLDGYSPQVISKLSTLKIAKHIHCGYDRFEEELDEVMSSFEEDKNVPKYVTSAILITDIAPTSEEIVERLNNLFTAGLTIVLLDHHDTAKWISEKYPEWAFITSKINDRLTSATELYYLYLKEKDGFLTHVYESYAVNTFVEQVRSYDTWDWYRTGNDLAKELNSVLYILTPSQFIEMQLAKFVKIFTNVRLPDLFSLNETEQLLVNVENKREEKYIESRSKKMVKHEWYVDGKRYDVGVVFADQYHSTLGNTLNTLNPELNFVAILDMNSGKGSLRTIHKDVHVGNIAKSIAGGGGHPKAAGFEFDSEKMTFLTENALGLLPQSSHA